MNIEYSEENLSNKAWRMANLYKVVDKDSKIVTFKKNAAQEHFDLHKHSRNIILKARQLGFTTDEAIDGTDDVMWTPNFKMLFLSYDQDSAKEIFDDKIKFAWENYQKDHPSLAALYRIDSDRSNKLKFDFGDGQSSSIIVRNKGRSGMFNRIHVSEYAKICVENPGKAKEIIAGTIPAAPVGSRVDIESTAEGANGRFHDMFWDAWNRTRQPGEKEFKAHFYNWTWDKDQVSKTEIIDVLQMDSCEKFIAYRDKIKREDGIELSAMELSYYYSQWLALQKDWKLLMQEFPTTPEEAFISSGAKFFERTAVDALKADITDYTVEGDWKIFCDYIPGHVYGIGCDVSHGVGKDSSTIVVMDFTREIPVVVACYASNQIEADSFGHIIHAAGIRYGSPIICVENNDRGHTSLTTLKKVYNVNRIYKRKNKNTEEETKELGWNTNGATKPLMMTAIKNAVNEGLLAVPDKVLHNEMRTYDANDLDTTKFDEEATNHWDLLIALALCWQMRTEVRQSTSNGGFKGITKTNLG